jgi:hypothetical protein
MYRLFAIGVVLMWVSATVALIARDVWPAWTAQDPPPMQADRLARMHQETEQFRIVDGKGQRIGTGWREFSGSDAGSAITGWMEILNIGPIPRVRVRTETRFDGDGGLDAFDLDVYDVPMTKIQVHGERRGIYFPCQLQIGPLRREASLDLSASRMMGESMQPFSYLPELKVGQSWRMQLLDPISAVMSQRTNFQAMVATVTGLETIESPEGGEPVECFVVETSPRSAVAWVDRNGRVLRQRAQMPGFGQVTVQIEPFEPDKLERVRKAPRRRARSSTKEAD